MARAEREAISRRNKEALVVAEGRGVKFGNPNEVNAHKLAGKDAVALRAAVVASADRHAKILLERHVIKIEL